MKQQLLEKIGSYKQRENEIDKQLKEIDIKLTQIKNKTQLVESFKQFYNLTETQLKLLSPQQKRELISLLLREVSYSPRKNEIKIEKNYIPIQINQ